MSLNASIPFVDPFPEAPPVSVPEPVEEPAEVREVAACLVVGSSAEVERFQGMAKIMGETMTTAGEVSEEEGARGSDLLLELVGRFTPPEFRFDCVPTRIVDQGEQFDVYVIRGGDQARARFNVRVGQIGGKLADLGEPGLQAVAYAERVLDRTVADDAGSAAVPRLIVNLPNAVPGWDTDLDWDCLCRAWGRLAGGVGTIEVRLSAGASPVVEGERVGHKHRSPSDERYRLRHKYGVTRSQLESFGVPAEAARYISDRVKDELKAGEEIVTAIENAHKLWATAGLEWDWIDRLNLRIEAELTVPRMVRDGRSLEEAMSLAKTTDAFMETGWSVGDAFAEAERYWHAKSTGNAHVMKNVQEGLRAARFSLFFDELTGNSGPDVWERTSGAQWVARVAADLCEERNPKTGRFYTLQEAARQAGTEWQSMTRGARIGVRDEYYGIRGLESLFDENYFVSTLAKASLVRAHGVDESVADLIVPLILTYAQQGKDLMTAIDAGRWDWQEASQTKSPPPTTLAELLAPWKPAALPVDWLPWADPQPPVVEEKVDVREEVDLGGYRPMCGCQGCQQFRQAQTSGKQ